MTRTSNGEMGNVTFRYVANLQVHRAEAMGALESQVSKPRWFGEPMRLEVVWGDFTYYVI